MKQRGFTIVELLIVIVVIAILAALTIVAYTGITVRANASRAKANAQSILKVVETYQQDDSTPTGYPTADQLKAYAGISRVPSSVGVMGGTTATGLNLAAGALSSTVGADGKVIQYTPKGTTGGCVGYWDASLATPAAVYLFVGNASAATNGATPTCT